MSEISEQVAREHVAVWHDLPDGGTWRCGTCGPSVPMVTESDMATHTAAVTEAAVRETIAADIEAVRIGIDNSAHPADRAARIARGET